MTLAMVSGRAHVTLLDYLPEIKSKLPKSEEILSAK